MPFQGNSENMQFFGLFWCDKFAMAHPDCLVHWSHHQSMYLLYFHSNPPVVLCLLASRLID